MQPLSLWQREPAIVERIVTVLLVCLLAIVAKFVTGASIGLAELGGLFALVGAVGLGGALVTRSQVVPTSKLAAPGDGGSS